MRFPLAAAMVLAACRSPQPPPSSIVSIRHAVATDPVSEDPDDPAIWVHPTNPEHSLILGTNKAAAPRGALVAYGLDGRRRQVVVGLNRPNNVDVEYGWKLGGAVVDIAVVTERFERCLRLYRIDRLTGALAEVSGRLEVFAGEAGEAGAPMGIALFKRPRDGVIFAIVGRKTGPRNGYLWQYRIEDAGAGRARLVKVREFGRFSGGEEIEAIAVDDELGYVYYADEGDGIHKYHADPDHPDAVGELAHFGREGFLANREGIAIYARRGGAGYILCTDQIDGNSRYRIYRREGRQGNPHDHAEVLKVIAGGADATDGLEASSANLGARFPRGLLVAMNSGGKNFLVYRWEDVAGSGERRLDSGR